MCVLQAPPPSSSDLPTERHSCECVESWGRGEESTSSCTSKLRAPPQASGLWAAFVCGSSLHLCFCCLSRCQNSVLLRGLNFWKPIKMCLLWVGSRASGCRPLPLFGVPLPPCTAHGAGSVRPWKSERRMGQPCCALCPSPRVNFS